MVITRALDRLKWSVETCFMHNFRVYFYTKKLLQVFPFLLPHEKDYFGLKQLLPENGLFLDVGANDGISARSFRRINSNYRILSLEPNPLHRPSLERLKRRDPCFDFRLCAAGDEAGSATLTTPTYKGIPNHSGAFCAPEQRAVFEAAFQQNIVTRLKYVTQTVPVIRVDELGLSPTVVKIDAEGYELKIIHGMQETIARCRPILMVENNPSTVDAVTKLLVGFGYEVWKYEHNNNTFVKFSGGRTRNLFFTAPPDSIKAGSV